MPMRQSSISKTLLVLIVLAPLIGAILAGLFGRQIGRAGAHTVTILGVAVSCALSVLRAVAAGAGRGDLQREPLHLVPGRRHLGATSASWSTS